MITLYHFFLFNNSLSNIKILIYAYILCNFQCTIQWLNIGNKITEDNLLIQDSFYNWMIVKYYRAHCPRPGNVRFLYCLSSWGNQRFPRRCRSASACSHLPSQTRLRLAPADAFFPRKEVIQPHLPVRLPCYDFTPVTNPALGRCFQMVSSRTSGVVDFHGVTGGVYKTRERIQRSVLICVY